jgi:micrococcal nuclease
VIVVPTQTPQILPTDTLQPRTATFTPEPQQNCDSSYPTVCIPPPPPDLDCKDIPYRRFTVLRPDPHRFDRDGNGIGCES